MQTFEQGDSIDFKITIQAKSPDPFGAEAVANPDNGAKITITDPEGTVIVNAASMSNSSTGKYYYTFQTTTSHVVGIWEYLILADGTTYDNVFCDRFRLKAC